MGFDCFRWHCVKSVQIRSFFWSVFSCIRTEYGDWRSKSPYSVQIQENADQKKFRIWTLFTQCDLVNTGISLNQIFLDFVLDPLFLRVSFFLPLLLKVPILILKLYLKYPYIMTDQSPLMVRTRWLEFENQYIPWIWRPLRNKYK